MSVDEDKVLGWDDEISNDGEFQSVVVEPGEYAFEIVNLKRARHQKTKEGKLPDCPKAIVTARVVSKDGVQVDIENNLFLHSRCEGMLCAFFRAIGQRKHGEPLRPNWGTVVGSRGRCKVGVREWVGNDGEKRKSNEIKSFLDPVKSNGNHNTTPPSTGGF